jgi:hypothetical protein
MIQNISLFRNYVVVEALVIFFGALKDVHGLQFY